MLHARYLLLSLMAFACVDPINGVGLPCPCGEGTKCCATTSTCIAEDDVCGNTPADAGKPDTGRSDSGDEEEDTGVRDIGGSPDAGGEDANDTGAYRVAVVLSDHVEVHDLGDGLVATLAPGSTVIDQPRWSPTGEAIALSVAETVAYSVETRLYQVESGADLGMFPGSGADWSTDPNHVGAIDGSTSCIQDHLVAEDQETCLFEPGAFGELRWDPSGALRFAFLEVDTYVGEQLLIVRDTNNVRFQVDTDVHAFAWSPTGSEIAYLVDDAYSGLPYYGSQCTLYSATVDESAVVDTDTLITDAQCDARFAWSPTGALIAYADDASYSFYNGLFLIVRAATPVAREDLAPLHSVDYYIERIEWTPDGDFIGYSTIHEDRMMLNLSPITGGTTQVLERSPANGEFSFRP